MSGVRSCWDEQELRGKGRAGVKLQGDVHQGASEKVEVWCVHKDGGWRMEGGGVGGGGWAGGYGLCSVML